MIATAEMLVDSQKVDAFATRLTGILNSGALALGLSIGHRTGLFDALEALPPATSAQIASHAELDERYVREWLGAMVTGGLVEYDPAGSSYRLPPEHAALLTRRNSPNNLAVAAQFLPVIASVEDRIVDCFREGGGVGYDHFGRFHEVMAEESRQTVVAALFDHILPLAAELPARLRDGIEVADIGCGMGRALIALASEYPNQPKGSMAVRSRPPGERVPSRASSMPGNSWAEANSAPSTRATATRPMAAARCDAVWGSLSRKMSSRAPQQ